MDIVTFWVQWVDTREGGNLNTAIEADYVIVGAGAVGLAFADTILADSDATIAIIDRHGRPGGHWNDAYSFVQLHQPSAFYGVDSMPLGADRRDTHGWNEGYYELATGAEVSAYFERVMTQHFLPSGRVSYFPMTEYLGDGTCASLLSGKRAEVKARRKHVDATYYGTSVPSTHTPKFAINAGANVVPPNALPDLWKRAGRMPSKYVILGAGKTGMDVGVWLVNAGADPADITWVVPRDSWLLNRHHTQPGVEFFHQTIGGQADQMQALAEASDLRDLFHRLEACGVMMRIDETVEPTMYHCATISRGEVEILRRIENVVRGQRVRAVSSGQLQLDRDAISFPEDTLFIDCTATAVDRRPAVPVFQDDLITLQMVRTCQPAFSSALIGQVELNFDGDARKNALTQVVPLPDGPQEFLLVTLASMMNQHQWSQEPRLREWMLASRLDRFSDAVKAVDHDDVEKRAVIDRFKAYTAPAIANIHTLLAQQAAG